MPWRPRRIVIVAGAGIGGLTAALALARNGFRVVVLEQAERLEETGAGIQLSPNATRTLIDLGLGDRLRPHVVAPTALRVLTATQRTRNRAHAARRAAAQRYGAPYWMIHRGDLQAALAARSRTISIYRSSSACGSKISPRIQWGDGFGARFERAVGRARGCADRRRRIVVGVARSASAPRMRRDFPDAPHGGRCCRQAMCARISRSR